MKIETSEISRNTRSIGPVIHKIKSHHPDYYNSKTNHETIMQPQRKITQILKGKQARMKNQTP